MGYKTFRQVIFSGLVLLLLAALFLFAGCTRSPVASVATATVPATTATATLTPTATPPNTATSTAAPTASPTATPAPLTFISRGETLPATGTALVTVSLSCVAGADPFELRSGPAASFSLIKTLPAKTTLFALKQSADRLWLLVETPQREIGWVDGAVVSCRGNLARLPLAVSLGTPVAAALPTQTAVTGVTRAPTWTPTAVASPTLPPPSLSSWRGEYFDNPNLAGEPVLVRDDPVLKFAWGIDSPAPNIPADNFSARWTRPFEFIEGGDYRFVADVDDAVKLYLDGWLVIDEWNTNPYTLHSGVFADVQPGLHTVTVEFFESGGLAHIDVWFEKTLISKDNWIGEYFNNTDFADSPAVVREDEDIDFDWGRGRPADGVLESGFSVRWQRLMEFDEGNYRFKARIADEDRVRIFLDNWLIVDKHKENGGNVEGSFENLGAGYHTIKVEYIDYSDDAAIEVDWGRYE
jgi:hypothetical protein